MDLASEIFPNQTPPYNRLHYKIYQKKISGATKERP